MVAVPDRFVGVRGASSAADRRRAKENGMAQLGKFVAGDVSESESESTYQKNYVY